MKFRSLVPFDFDKNSKSMKSLLKMQQEMDALFDDVTDNLRWPSFMRGEKMSINPRVDVKENDREMTVHAELPGIEEKDVEVLLSNNILTIRGEKKIEREEKKENYHLVECSSGNFMRSFAIPFETKPSQLEATFKNGVLRIKIKKPKGAEKGVEHIKIKHEK